MNKAILIGNLARDPEVRTTQSGIAMCTFTVAVTRKYANAGGERVTDFLPVITWRKTAENCGKYLAKGRKVSVVGEIQTRSYDAKDGTKRYVTEIVADEVEFLTPKSEGGSGGSNSGGGVFGSPDAFSGADNAHGKSADNDFGGFADIDESELPF